MKRIYMIGILVLLIVIVGAFILSPFSPMNKVTVNGETIKLSSGYTVKKSTENTLVIANDTNKLKIYPTKKSSDLKKEVKEYETEFGEKYKIETTKLNDSKHEIFKTEAIENNDTSNKTITKYWFEHKGKIYNMQTVNAVNGTDDVVIKIVSSMN